MTVRVSRTGTVWLWVAAIGCAVGYVVSGPPHVGDLAAQTARAQLFGQVGLVPWYAGWYGGLHVGGYSLLSPPLMWWLHPTGVGVVCLLATGPVGLALARSGRARRPVLGATTLLVFQLADLLSGRVTFALGAVIGLLAFLAAERDRRRWAGALAVVSSLASPVDGLIVVLFALPYLLSSRRGWGSADRTGGNRGRGQGWAGAGWALAIGAGVGLVVMIGAFPDPGFEPFTFAAMRPAALICLAVVVLPVGYRVRCGALLAFVLVAGAYLVHSPIGSNAQRLPLLVAVPVVAAAMAGSRLIVVPVMVGLAVWPYQQWRDDLAYARDAGSHAAFYTGLLTELRARPELADHRLEVVEPRSHWNVVYLQPTVTLARGWERQLDESLNPQLYNRPTLTAASYRAFLDSTATAEVALPHGTPLDFGSRPEAALISAGLPYLTEIWSDPQWTLYAVSAPTAMADGDDVSVVRLTDTGMVIDVPASGTVRLHLRYSPYLTVADGQVRRGPDDTTIVELNRAGVADVHAHWSFAGILDAVIDTT